MGYESVKEFSNLHRFNEKGDTLEGIFIRSYDYTSKKTGQVYKVHVLDQERESGLAEVQFFGTGQLDSLMAKIKEGDKIKIIYEGLTEDEIETKFGRKQVHQYDVLKAN